MGVLNVGDPNCSDLYQVDAAVGPPRYRKVGNFEEEPVRTIEVYRELFIEVTLELVAPSLGKVSEFG
nr:hypothetical protein [Salinibacterium sp.]